MTKTYAIQWDCEPSFGKPSPVIYTGFPSFSSAQFMMLLFLQIIFRLQYPGNSQSALSFGHCHFLFQRRRWASLWRHSSTVTRSTSRLSTGESWEGFDLNTVCCCWLYWYTGKACGTTSLSKQLAPCGLHKLNAATNRTRTLVDQFHLKINLQLTVEPQYCTYRIQLHYKLDLEAFHCSS
jgi:hypothetical protein